MKEWMNETFHGNSHIPIVSTWIFLLLPTLLHFSQRQICVHNVHKNVIQSFLRESKCDCDTCQNVTTIGSFLSSKTLIDGAKCIIMLVRI